MLFTSLPRQNRRFSTFQSVSAPSPAAPTSLTVMLPSTLSRMSYCPGSSAPVTATTVTFSVRNAAVSQFAVPGRTLTVRATAPSDVGAGQSAGAPVYAVGPIGDPLGPGPTISRTATRLPGSTRPANTACCSVIPAVPGPKFPDVACVLHEVGPADLRGAICRVGRTVMATRSAWSPSTMSSLPRPSIRSLPPPPRRMLPSAQTLPDSRPSGVPS